MLDPVRPALCDRYSNRKPCNISSWSVSFCRSLFPFIWLYSGFLPTCCVTILFDTLFYSLRRCAASVCVRVRVSLSVSSPCPFLEPDSPIPHRQISVSTLTLLSFTSSCDSSTPLGLAALPDDTRQWQWSVHSRIRWRSPSTIDRSEARSRCGERGDCMRRWFDGGKSCRKPRMCGWDECPFDNCTFDWTILYIEVDV